MESTLLAIGSDTAGLIDRLTGLQSRIGFCHLVEQQMRQALRRGRPLTFIFLGLFESSFGIPTTVADREAALQQVGGAISLTFRDADIAGRVSPECFAILLVDLKGSPDTALKRVVDELRSRHGSGALGGRQVRLSTCRWDPLHAQPVSAFVDAAVHSLAVAPVVAPAY